MNKFSIKFELEVYLDEEHIWPDKDGPKNPTAEDVMDVINYCARGIPISVIYDWNLSHPKCGDPGKFIVRKLSKKEAAVVDIMEK